MATPSHSDSPRSPTGAFPTGRPLRTTILMMAVHGFLWASWLLGLLLWEPRAESVFRDFNMKLPTMTEWVMALSRWIENNTRFVGIFICMLLVVDGVFYYHSRSSAPRFVSKLWSIFMLLVPVLIIVGTFIGILNPLLALQEGLSK